MNRIAIGIIIAAIAGVTATGGYYISREVNQNIASTSVTPSPEPSGTPEPTESVAPTETPDEEEEMSTATPRPTVAGTKQPSHWVSPTATPRPALRPTPEPDVPQLQTGDLQIRFVNTPSQVRSGEQFTVSWRIDGPSGATGSTSLAVKYNVSSQQGGSSSSVNSNNNQSFGVFSVPQVFSTNLRYGGTPGIIHITATATLDNNQTVSAQRDIQLVE